jgi:ribosomal protein L12E/L44/L45/RPP1/RPP2
MTTTTITLNLRKRLLKVHMPHRRKNAAKYAKEAIAKFAKADIEKIRFDSVLNRHLVLNVSRRPVKFKVTVEKLDNVVNVRLAGQKPAASAPAKSEAKNTEAKAEKKQEAKRPEAKSEAKGATAEAAKPQESGKA